MASFHDIKYCAHGVVTTEYCERCEDRDIIASQRKALEEAEQLIEQLEAALRDCIEDLVSWSAYASDYFQRKHDLPGCLAKHRAALNPEGSESEGDKK